MLPVRRPAAERSWQGEAACKGQDRSRAFYPPVQHESREERADREQRAKAICQACSVREDCLACAIETREPFGIWGGLTEGERRALLDPQS